MRVKRLPAARGLVWIRQGFNLFKHNPQTWLILSFVNFALLAVLEQISGMGALLSILLSPALVAGWLIGCHALAQDEPLKLAHLWAGFQHNTNRLISLGGVVLVTLVLVSALVMSLGGEAFATLIQNWKPTNDPQLLVKALGEDGVGAVLELLLVISIPLILLGLSMQFAPMLIVFRNLGVLIAMKVSTLAFINNIPPLTLYSLAWAFIYFTLLGLPEVMHSVVMIVLSPIIIASTYAAYRDIFPDEVDVPSA